MLKWSVAGAALCVSWTVAAATAVTMDERYAFPDGGAANRARVEAQAEGAYWKGAKLAACRVEALSGIRRTADLFPEDGDFKGPLKATVSGDEWESASVQLFAFEDLKDVLVTPADLVSKEGNKLPAAEIDVKVVKVWYQQGTAWGSFFADGLRRIATPELLLHDDSLVVVDHVAHENYLRCDYGSSSAYRWVSFDATDVAHTHEGQVDLKWIHDAETLSPFALQKHAFKQLMFTIHAPKGLPAGLYRGAFAVTVGGRKAFDLPVEVRALGFDLPQPATFRDLNRRFFGAAYMGKLHFTVQDHPKMLKNIARHNMKNFLMNPFFTPGDVEHHCKMYQEAGCDTDYLFGALPYCGIRTSYPAQETDASYVNFLNIRNSISNTLDAIRAVLGKDAKAYSYGIDEGSAWTVRCERDTWKNVHRLGGNVCVATRYHPFLLFNLDLAILPRQPRQMRRFQADTLHEGNPDALVMWYADPHSGPENPDYTRRIYGWQTWRCNYDGFMQYILFRDNWNDFWVPNEGALRGLMLAYPAADDLLDTIEWEGLREGVDDVRYCTYLRQLVAEGRKSGDAETDYAARAAATWLSQVDCERSSLAYLRAETIARINKLRKLLGK